MDIDNNEYVSDIEYTLDVRQTFNTDTQSDAGSSIAIEKLSFVWKYFEEEDAKEDMEDIESETKLHLRLVHEIFRPDEIQSNPDEKHQLSIAKMFKKKKVPKNDESN
ncbi:18099_t:CDS:2 [Cetraspora pellucida]|uniref:18099_t:CDS:1 n=1 Tax=Cetraspora pellucida TaxID=1433469 RepID=A0ACA9KWT0_9GLOM|nr:18099_t:CDS:2 [Cetraspora pellucida]